MEKGREVRDCCICTYNVALCRACRPWIFFINGVLCFLKINRGRMKKEKGEMRCHFKEKMSQEQTHHHRKPWIRA